MSDGIYERNNIPSRKDNKLRYEGDELGDTPEYSAGLDYSVGATSLNTNPRASEEQHGNRITKADAALRGKTGLIIKEPLT